MPFIEEGAREEIRRHLGQLPNPVRLVLFTRVSAGGISDQNKTLLSELVSLSGDLEMETHDFDAESGLAAMYGVAKTPALIVQGVKGGRVRFYGLPGGREFLGLVESIREAGAGRADLEPATRDKLGGLSVPVHIQVFVTLNCPYCLNAVRTAHRFALEFPRITADMIESAEFPDLVSKYGVQGVPKTIVNDKVELLGAGPEADLAGAVLAALKT